MASLVFLLLLPAAFAYHCDRTPDRAVKPQNRVDVNRYVIEISGNAKSYVPGENYTISLRSNPSSPQKHRFTEFTLVVEPENTLDSFQTATGNFHLIDQMLTRFSIKCRNTVSQTNTLAKTHVVVSWIAPPTKSGCVSIKATVFESSDNWFSDDGELTRTLCEEDAENEDVQPAVLRRCCACDEAKYEVAFQGLWSRNTHPKDFPTDVWTTKFGDMVGASHKLFKSFWNYGGMASDGLRLLAEAGNGTLLEGELKEMVKNDDIRTIIKARELTYPNITGTSYTVFRVDKENHVISLVSKISPSPDWIVGVANLELCQRNCTWVEAKTLNLYPWDVGTDEGLSYNSADQVSVPQQSIRRIKSNNPNKEESPFFNDEGEAIKPLAKLHLTRQKLYEKTCETADETSDPTEEVDPNCATSEWSQWSPCSTICYQFRQRSYVNPTASHHCLVGLVESAPCRNSENCQGDGEIEVDGSKCELSEWSEWSGCSVQCGTGVRTRDRGFAQEEYQAACGLSEPQLVETEECEGGGDDCTGDEEEKDCPNASWSEWTACSVTCGSGVKMRQRETTEVNEEDEDDACQEDKQTVECYKPECENEELKFGGIPTDNQILIAAEPDGPVVDCKVSKWSTWTACNASEPCKKGYKYRERHIRVHAQNGGRACPRKLQKKKRCKADCEKEGGEERETLPSWGPTTRVEESVDCEMGHWSAWSPCSTICGKSAVQVRTRGVRVYQKGGGAACGPRMQKKSCPLPLACTDRGTMPVYQ